MVKEEGRDEGDERGENGAAHEIGVVFAQDEFACVLVDGIAGIQVAEEWSGEETWDIGVVHSIYCFPSATLQEKTRRERT
jgi:hypothetical protein